MRTLTLFFALAVGPWADPAADRTNGWVLRTRVELDASGGGQQPKAVGQATPSEPRSSAQSAEAPPAGQETYSYQPEGRRDPFVGLLGTGLELRTPLKRSDGPAGLTVGEASVRGVITSNGAPLAMIQAPDKRTYVVHPGDKLMDGTIKSVTPQGLVIVQDVSDPLSLVKQREVRKSLRSAEDSKQ